MKKALFYYSSIIILSFVAISILIYNGYNFDNHYEQNKIVAFSYDSNIPIIGLTGVASERAVIPVDTDINSDLFSNNTYACLLVDNENNNALVAYNAHRRIYPASMTKLVTAMVVCDAIERGQISLDDMILIPERIKFKETGVMQSALEANCQISVKNLMYGLLIKSYNDYAVILAETVAGTVDDFAILMNEKAASIGATNSHFVNPHGLHDDNHYVSAYDMYLIVNSAHEYELINEIDSYKNYSYTFITSIGTNMRVDLTPTNQYLSEKAVLPSNIRILTWKTGTTNMAGRCISMVVSINDKEYTLVVADKVSATDLYSTTSMMFNLAN